jgi:hypothetical protein
VKMMMMFIGTEILMTQLVCTRSLGIRVVPKIRRDSSGRFLQFVVPS